MAEILPFKAVRYDRAVVGDLSKVVSPPYDVISPEDRIYYHRLHPYNFVRLILGQELPEDDKTNNRFTRATAYLHEWLAQGVLREDPEPAIYAYEQQFQRDGAVRTIRGIQCAVRIHDYSDRVILPHENTLAKPRSQLAQLIRATAANLDSIYGLYADTESVLVPLLEGAALSEPEVEAFDRDGVRHRLWAVTDSAAIASVRRFFQDRLIAIADGHHRYETALAYRDEMRAKHGGSEFLPSDYVLMTLVNVHQEDMTILPTHRVVGRLSPKRVERLDAALGDLFEVRESTRPAILEDMSSRDAIGMYRAGRAHTLRPRPGSAELIPGSPASRKLELNVLHTLILHRILGIDEGRLRNETNIRYTRDAAEAMDLVDSGERQVAFLLNRIDVESVLHIASAGERMPQKATYFYPKLLSGLVLRRMG